MIPFSLTPQFLKSAEGLEKDKTNKTFKALLLFFANRSHPSLNYEKLSGKSAALNSIRVDQGYRIILQITSTMIVFHYVGNHDDAYRIAQTIAPVIPARLRGAEPA